MTAPHHDDPVSEFAGHAAGVLHAALAVGNHAATILAQRHERLARDREHQARQVATLADQRAEALERVRALPTHRDPRAAADLTPGVPGGMAARDRYAERWRDTVLGAGADDHLADRIGRAAGLGGLVELCDRLAADDRVDELQAALATAVGERTFGDVRDPAAVLRHRTATQLGEPSAPGRSGPVPTLSRARRPGPARPVPRPVLRPRGVEPTAER